MARTLEVVILGKDKLSGALKGIGGGLQGLGKVALGVGAVGGAAIAGIGIAMGKLAVDSAPVEGIRKAFEGIAESSGESAGAVLAALQKGSSGMITQRDLMASYNKAAQLVSTTFANELPDAMGYLSKVAAATGQDMGYMMDSLVTGVGRGSKMILDNLGITVDLDKAYQDWADSLGVAKDALTDEQKQAGLMNQVMTLLAKNTAAMPEITDLSTTKMAALRATFSNLKDTIGTALLPALNVLIDKALVPLAEKASAAAGVFQEFLPQAIAEFGRALSGEVTDWEGMSAILMTIFGEEMGLRITEALDTTLMPAFRSIADFLQNQLIPVIQTQVIPTLQNLGRFILEIAQAVLPVLVGAIRFVVDHWQIFGAIAAAIGLVILALQAPITLIVGAIVLLATAWANNWGGIQDKVRAVWENVIKPVLEGIWGGLQYLWNEVLPRVLTAFQEAWQGIQDAVAAAWEILAPKIEDVKEALAEFWEEIQPQLETAWEAIKTAMVKVKDWIVGTLIPKLQDLWDALEPVRDIIGKVAAKFLDFMASAFVTTIKVWLRVVADLFGKVGDAIGGVVGWIEDLIGAIQRAIDWLKDLAEAMSKSGGPGQVPTGEAPSKQSGMSYVPYSPYPAWLHQGEAVLTRRQAADWRAGGGRSMNVYVYAGGVYGMDGAENLIEDMIREQARYVR